MRSTAGPRQPVTAASIEQLMGLLHGIVADGVVTQDEAEDIQGWLQANMDASNNPVVMELYHRIRAMLEDQVLDADESAELLDTLAHFSDGDFEIGELQKATTLPLNKPAPEVIFQDHNFCFAATFAMGTRRTLAAEVQDRGGSVSPLGPHTNYLVIGVYATDAWPNTRYGQKIDAAVALRNQGQAIQIISEARWTRFL